MSITNERRDQASRILREQGFSEKEISSLHSEVPKTRSNKNRAEYIRTVLGYIKLHGEFPPKEVYTKFPQCPVAPTSQRELNNRIRKKYTKDTGLGFTKEDKKFKVENFEAKPEHQSALDKVRKTGSIDLVKEGIPCNDDIHNFLLGHSDIVEVGASMYQYKVKEEVK